MKQTRKIRNKKLFLKWLKKSRRNKYNIVHSGGTVEAVISAGATLGDVACNISCCGTGCRFVCIYHPCFWRSDAGTNTSSNIRFY